MNLKAKIEKRIEALEIKHPELLSGKVCLGSKDHPNIEKFKQAHAVVPMMTIDKYKRLRFIIKKWNQCETSRQIYLDIGYLFRQNNWYNYAKQLEQEMGGSNGQEI